MDWGLILTFAAIMVAGVAAVVGLWMERDQARPPRWAVWLTVLILLTTGITVATSYSDSLADEERDRTAATRFNDLKGKAEVLQSSNEQLQQAAEESKEREEKMADDMARVLLKLNEMAGEGENPALQEFVKSEMTAQSRTNEGVVTAVAQRAADKGEDPDQVLARFLPENEIQRVKRTVKKREGRMADLVEKRRTRREGAAEHPTARERRKGGDENDKRLTRQRSDEADARDGKDGREKGLARGDKEGGAKPGVKAEEKRPADKKLGAAEEAKAPTRQAGVPDRANPGKGKK